MKVSRRPVFVSLVEIASFFNFFSTRFRMSNMELIRVLLLLIYFLIQTTCTPYPGNSHHHIHHRIHVPQKIKTVYHTKIIKVPEHHHYFHEKEKIIQVEAPKKKHPIYPPLKEEDLGDFSNFDNHEYFGESRHNVHRKRAPSIRKKHPIYPPLKEEDLDEFSDFDNHEYSESRHNVQRKRAPSVPKKHPVYPPLKEEGLADFPDIDDNESRRNVQKKRAPSVPIKLKKRKVFRQRH